MKRTAITTTLETEIPLEHIGEMRAEKTFNLLPNAIAITTIREGRVRVLVSDRDSWIEAIRAQMDKI